jgi:hypothetical protein
MPGELTSALRVRVRLLDEPSLWCWEITDGEGWVLASSFSEEWAAYATREEARAAGERRLAERLSGGPRRASAMRRAG